MVLLHHYINYIPSKLNMSKQGIYNALSITTWETVMANAAGITVDDDIANAMVNAKANA